MYSGMADERRKKWLEKLKKEQVIIFGAGNYARQFYKDFVGTFEFVDCITNKKEESSFRIDDKEVMEVHNPPELLKYKHPFVIVCVAQPQEILEQLRAMGYCYGGDFIESEMLRVILSEKKIAVFYGVCYIRAIYTCLLESDEFQTEYEAMYWLDYLRRDARQEQLFFLMLELCDLFVCNAFLSESARKKNDMYMGRLKKNCKVVSIPMLMFNGYYPCPTQYIGRDNEYSIVASNSPYAPFITPDREINRMIREGKNLAEIIKRVSSVDYYSRDYVRENYITEMRKLELAELLATVKITDFLYDRHGKERTFLNEKHVSNIVIWELAQRVLKELNMPQDVSESVCGKRLLYTSEVPLYPSVIDALDLDIYKGKTILFTFKGDMELTFEEYVEVYVDYCISMDKYKTMGFFP
jgi:UDP-2,3-diacylglucosamine pyrophosphatase LpxH